MEDQELTAKIIGCAMKVHSTLGPGFLESVYQKVLSHELGKAALKVDCERPITVHYDGIAVGDFSADMVVEDRVMLELKANQALAPANEVQVRREPACGSFLSALTSQRPRKRQRTGEVQNLRPASAQESTKAAKPIFASPM